MAATRDNSNQTITVDKAEYDALIQAVKVTDEYIKGQAKSFSTPEALIEHLNE